MSKILYCDSKGDKNFSAFYAQVTLLGVTDSIENYYQLSKRFGDKPIPKTWRDAKGKTPTHFHAGGKDFDCSYLSTFYKVLWWLYLRDHPKLVKYAQGFDVFIDRFKGKSTNCQADVIEQYIKEGSASVLNECLEFLEVLLYPVVDKEGYNEKGKFDGVQS